ncbi:MAG: hypothetical protein QOH49_3371 [Acidobacteriota bacterium]|jgi:hypothetical protein|nr:hypothetical protein [Acidobacteriota bacterium]
MAIPIMDRTVSVETNKNPNYSIVYAIEKMM